MFEDIKKIKETEKEELVIKRNNFSLSIEKLKKIRNIYEKEIRNKNSTNINKYMEEKMSVKILLSEISTINEQLKNFKLKVEYIDKLLINKNIEIEKYNYFINEEKTIYNKNKEEQEVEILQDYINLFNINKLIT